MSSRAWQKFYYQRYGTSLKGLMIEYGIDPHAFLDFVHDIDRSRLPPDPSLGAALAALPGRKLIFTNGSLRHAKKTAEQLGIARFRRHVRYRRGRITCRNRRRKPMSASSACMMSILRARPCSRILRRTS